MKDEFNDHARVLHTHDDMPGLDAVIDVHSLALGPTLAAYRSAPMTARTHPWRTRFGSPARCRTTAFSDHPFGGAKAVIIGDHETTKTDALLQAPHPRRQQLARVARPLPSSAMVELWKAETSGRPPCCLTEPIRRLGNG